MTTVQCQCEHIDHDEHRAHDYLDAELTDRETRANLAIFVGPVCDECYNGHMAACHETNTRTAPDLLDQIEQFHVRWGSLDVDSTDQLGLWEELGRLLAEGRQDASTDQQVQEVE